MTQTARQTAVANTDAAIASNVAKIEQAKRPNALEVMASRLNISAGALKNTLMATVFKDASDDQFAALIIVSNEYNLNPLTKEIYAFPAKGGIVPMVSIDGWIRIMNSHPMFDGIEFEDIPDGKGELMAIEATIYRKDRTRPVKVTEYLTECKRNTDPWNKSPARMLRHRALMQCARYAFGFSGIYGDDDEFTGEVQLGGDLTPEPKPAPMRNAKALPANGERTVESEETARELDMGFDPQTGEVSTGRTDAQHGDQQDGNEVDAAQAKADEIIAAAGRCEVIADLNNLKDDYASDIEFLPEHLMPLVAGAINGAEKRLKGGK